MTPTSTNGAHAATAVSNPARRPERAWPIGIGIVIGVFLLIMFGFLIFALMQSRDLVHESYYEEGLAHGDQMERIANANALSAPVATGFPDRNTLEVTLPPECVGVPIEGELHLYRPSAASWDQTAALDLNSEGKQWIDLTRLPRGMWRLKASWTMNDREFYHEQQVMLPR